MVNSNSLVWVNLSLFKYVRSKLRLTFWFVDNSFQIHYLIVHTTYTWRPFHPPEALVAVITSYPSFVIMQLEEELLA